MVCVVNSRMLGSRCSVLQGEERLLEQNPITLVRILLR
jgi:hypothetical protein